MPVLVIDPPLIDEELALVLIVPFSPDIDLLLPAADELPLVGRVFMELLIVPWVTVPLFPDIDALFPAADELPDFERLSAEPPMDPPISPLLDIDGWPGIWPGVSPLLDWPLMAPGELCIEVCAIAPPDMANDNAAAAAIIL